MATKKKGIPDFKYTPPPPEPMKAKTTEEFAEEILQSLSVLNAKDQNSVMELLNTRYAALRYDDYEKARNDERETGQNFERFMATTRGVEEFIKARHAAKELSK
jgi:hypothetical protein